MIVAHSVGSDLRYALKYEWKAQQVLGRDAGECIREYIIAP